MGYLNAVMGLAVLGLLVVLMVGLNRQAREDRQRLERRGDRLPLAPAGREREAFSEPDRLEVGPVLGSEALLLDERPPAAAELEPELEPELEADLDADGEESPVREPARRRRSDRRRPSRRRGRPPGDPLEELLDT